MEKSCVFLFWLTVCIYALHCAAAQVFPEIGSGSAPRFVSQYMCDKVCAARLSPAAACDRCDSRTSRCVAHGKYNYTCECLSGFSKNAHADCEDVDECRSHTGHCDANAWCVNTIGSYRCECMAGYRGDGKRCTYTGMGTPTSDCEKCSPHASCISGVCQCNPGFRGDGFQCEDANECMQRPYPCSDLATCQNTPGSFMCKCKEGYAGNGFTCHDNTRSCLDKRDRNYEVECAPGIWEERYVFDSESKTCSLIWYSGCNGTSRNIFPNLDTCEDMCERSHVLQRAQVCLEAFDEHYKDQCGGGRWRQFYYYDIPSRVCRAFWYDGCKSQSQNIFMNLETCVSLCEQHEMVDETRPWMGIRKTTNDTDGSTMAACDPNPCMNGGACSPKGDGLNYECKCVNGWHGLRCTDPPENACESSPCKNGGSCFLYKTPVKHFKCECLPNFFGPYCDPDPCLSNPCINNGTCRTMKGFSTFFCDCPNRFSGSRCQFDKHTGDVSGWPGMGPRERQEVDIYAEKRAKQAKEGTGFVMPARPGSAGRPGAGGLPAGFPPRRKGAQKLTSHIPEEDWNKYVEKLSSGREPWMEKLKQSKVDSRSVPVADLLTKEPTISPQQTTKSDFPLTDEGLASNQSDTSDSVAPLSVKETLIESGTESEQEKMAADDSRFEEPHAAAQIQSDPSGNSAEVVNVNEAFLTFNSLLMLIFMDIIVN